jgi:hypothetical protein
MGAGAASHEVKSRNVSLRNTHVAVYSMSTDANDFFHSTLHTSLILVLLYTTSLDPRQRDRSDEGQNGTRSRSENTSMSHLETPLTVTNQKCPTPQHLQAELENLNAILALGEKEETWDKMEKALIRFAGVTRGGGYKHLPLFTDGIGRKGCASKVAECVCHFIQTLQCR